MAKRKLTQKKSTTDVPRAEDVAVARTLSDTMAVVRYPDVVYWLSPDEDNILALTRLKTSDSMSSCGCKNVVGELYADDGAHVFTNRFEVEMSDCYLTVRMAMAALELRRLREEKQKFINKYREHSCRRAERIRMLMAYPDIVNRYITDNFVIDAEKVKLTPGEVKVTHIREALQERGWGPMLNQILDLRFPTLAADGDGGDDE